METSDHQEWRARQKVNWRAIMSTTAFVGGVLFVMSGGSPWSTAGTMNASMGRDLPLGFFTLLGLHLLLSFIYVTVIAHVIYRLRVISALFAALAMGAVLYAVNYAIFHGLATQMQSPEGRVVFVHFSFSLFTAVVYKGSSVPRPFRGSESQVKHATEETVAVADTASDPEPENVSDRPEPSQRGS